LKKGNIKKSEILVGSRTLSGPNGLGGEREKKGKGEGCFFISTQLIKTHKQLLEEGGRGQYSFFKKGEQQFAVKDWDLGQPTIET